jgi:hypothetical protein
MKIALLINVLKKFPKDSEVFFSTDEEGNSYHKEVTIEKWEGFDDDMLKAAGLSKDDNAICFYPYDRGFQLC